MKANEVNVDNIADVSIDQVFEWVKTGVWSKRDFSLWYLKSFIKHYSEVTKSIRTIEAQTYFEKVGGMYENHN